MRSLHEGRRSWRSPSVPERLAFDPVMEDVDPVTAAAAAAIDADVDTAVMEDEDDEPEIE